MKWSKLKQRVEDSFADSVSGRIQIFTTAYRRMDQLSRSWVVIDGKQKISLSDATSYMINQAYFHELTPTRVNYKTHESIDDSERNKNKLYEDGEFSSYDFKIIAFEYLNTSAYDSVQSKHPLMRSLGVLNKKIGKHKAKEMQNDTHPMVAFFAKFRYEAEQDINQI